MAQQDDNLEDFIANWDLFRNRLVIFLGAGASIGARNRSGFPLPNAYELRNQLWTKFKSKPGEQFDPTDLRLMSLEHAAAIVEARIGRTVLNEHLVESFSCSLPLWQHLVMPFLLPTSVFTTNYDELVELGYKSHSPVIDVVCTDRAPMSGRTALFKPHGSLSHANQMVGQGGLVITQFDYFEMIAEYRKMLHRAMTGLSSTCVLLIGYSFGDMDIGAELYRIRKASQGIPWYAVFPRDDQQVRKMYSNRFGIHQINRRFDDFLAELDESVNFIPDDFKWGRASELRARGAIQ